MEGAGSFAGTVFNCGMTEGTVAATAGDRFAAAGSAGARSARNWASVSNIPVTISWRSWHSFRVSCSIARADSASCLVRHTREQPGQQIARTARDDGCSHRRYRDAGLRNGLRLASAPSSPGPAGCGCPAAPPSSTRSRRLRPPAFAAPVDGAIGGTERAGFEFTAAEPTASASADCVLGADGEHRVQRGCTRCRHHRHEAGAKSAKMCRGGHSGVHPRWAASARQG